MKRSVGIIMGFLAVWVVVPLLGMYVNLIVNLFRWGYTTADTGFWRMLR